MAVFYTRACASAPEYGILLCMDQPAHTPPTGIGYGFTVVAILVSLAVGFAGGYFIGNNNASGSTNAPGGIPAATTMDTVNWKTYTSTNQQYAFKYPEQLIVAYATDTNNVPDQNIPHFYLSEKEAQDAVGCIERKEATLQKPCDQGLFDVSDVTNSQEITKQPIDIYRNSSDPTLPKTEDFEDSQGRKWTMLGPTYVIGGTQTDAQLKVGDKSYQLQVHIWDRFVDGSKEGAADVQKRFIKQILDTTTFSY